MTAVVASLPPVRIDSQALDRLSRLSLELRPRGVSCGSRWCGRFPSRNGRTDRCPARCSRECRPAARANPRIIPRTEKPLQADGGWRVGCGECRTGTLGPSTVQEGAQNILASEALDPSRQKTHLQLPRGVPPRASPPRAVGDPSLGKFYFATEKGML